MDFLPKEIAEYTERFTEAESPLLTQLARYTYSSVMYPRMLSGHLQGRVLSMLSHLLRPKFILEVGTYTGYSALCLAEGLAEGGKLYTIDINEELSPIVKKYVNEAGMEDYIVPLVGDAQNIIPTLNYSWDMVFIDADKENYANYYDLVIDRMRPGGIIVADNVLWSGKVVDKKALANDKDTQGIHLYNQKILHDPRVENVLLPVRDGLMVARVIS